MTAVTSSECQPLIVRCSEIKDEENQAVITAFKSNSYACACMRLAEKVYVEYGTANVILEGTNAEVYFRVAAEPAGEITDFLPTCTVIPKAMPFATLRTVYANIMQVYVMEKVQSVTINVHLLNPPGTSPILGAVSLFGRTAFPNIEPDKPVVNLYWGSKAWRANGLFSDPSEKPRKIKLIVKA